MLRSPDENVPARSTKRRRKYVSITMSGSGRMGVAGSISGAAASVTRSENTTGNRFGFCAGTLRTSQVYCD